MANNKFGDIMTNAQAYNLLQNVNEEQLFYASKQHSKFLDLLTHLSRYSNLLLTLVGPSGSGKTHIKNRFLANLDSGVVVSKMHGDNVADIKDLSARIAQTFNLENHSLSRVQNLVAEFRQNVESYTEDGKSCLIVIDNAEKLQDASIQLLLELANTHEDSQRPHIVLIGREELAQRLDSSPHKALFEPVGHLLELSPFTEEETAKYIEYRLRSVGIKVFPFNDSEFNEIYLASKGWTGKINEILLNYFKDNKSSKILPNNKMVSSKIQSKAKSKAKTAKSGKKSDKKSLLFPLISAFIFIALALLLYFFGGSPKNPLEKNLDDKREATILGKKIKSASSNATLEELNKTPPKDVKEQLGNPFADAKDKDINQAKISEPKLEEPSISYTQPKTPADAGKNLTPETQTPATQTPASPTTPSIESEADLQKPATNKDTSTQSTQPPTGVDPAFTQIEPNKDEAPQIIDLTNVEPQPVEPLPTKPTEQKSTPPKAQTPATPAQVQKTTPAKPKEALPPKPKIPETVKQVTSNAPKITSPYKKEQWLLKQARYKYTLQFFGSHTEKNVIGFIENLPSNIRKDFVYYETKLDKRPWYVVVSGVYANRALAVAAINRLSASLKKMDPWAHSFGGIQDDIKEK